MRAHAAACWGTVQGRHHFASAAHAASPGLCVVNLRQLRKRLRARVACQAQQQQQQQQQEHAGSTGSSIMRPLEVSRSIAAARAAESSRTDALFQDPYTVAFCAGQHQQEQHGSTDGLQQQQQQREAAMDIIATRYIDECLMNAMAATNINSIQAGDYRQVVLLGDGMDCRPFRLPWPPGTLLFLVAPAEVHEQAEAQLAAAAATPAAAAAAEGEAADHQQQQQVPPAHVMRGCLLRRVNMNLAAAAAGLESGNGSSSSSSGGTIFMQELQKAGFRADRLSVWALQGLRNQGIVREQLQELLTEVTNLAAFHSLLVGELPGSMSKREVENLLAEAGLLGAVVTYDQEDVSYGRWQEVTQSDALGGSSAAAAADLAAGEADVRDDVIQDRWLVTGQQLRLSLEQMGIYEEWSSEFADSDMGDDYIGNFS